MIGLVAKGGHLPVELGLAYDIDPEKARKFETWGWRAASSLDEVLEKCDLIWICVPTAHHLPLVTRAALAGVAGIFCEKPLGRNLSEALEVERAAGGVPTQVGLVLRTTPPFRIAKWALDSGLLGTLQSVMFRDDQHVPVRGMYRSTWRKNPELAGSGVLLEHSIHDADLIEWLAGPVMWAAGHVLYQVPVAQQIEDTAVATFGTKDGSVSSLTTIWHNVDRRTSNRRVEIFGTEGVLTIENEVTGPVTIERRDGVLRYEGPDLIRKLFELEQPWFGEDDPLRYVANEDARFIRCVVEGRPPSPGLSEAVRAHVIVDAVYTSSRKGGERVECPPTPGAGRPSHAEPVK
jgi:predicted dehydrogenase